MSKWLGLGTREAQSTVSPGGRATVAAKHTDNPEGISIQHRRGSSAETEQASRRSSKQSQHETENTKNGGNVGVVRNAMEGRTDRSASVLPADESNALEDGWEILTDEVLQPSIDNRDRECDRPLSPGVDFSNAYVVSKDCRDVEEVTGGEETDCKWVDAGKIHCFLVRGPTYLVDKGKRPAGAAMCRLVAFDCFSEGSKQTTRIDHIASRGKCRERVEELTSGDEAPFLFIMNIQVRGTPTISLVAYWAIEADAFREARDALQAADGEDATEADENTQAGEANESNGGGRSPERVFALIVASYANIPLSTFGGDDCLMMDEAPPAPYSDERNRRFKLIPRVIGGPWMVRKAVGSTPVLLGTKINHRYYRGERYVETAMDTGSSPAAASLCGRCRGLSRKLDVELGVVLQANSPQELPEVLLGAVRLNGFGVEDAALQKKLFSS